jgi:DNA-binding CsgD family transcriptional regulator
MSEAIQEQFHSPWAWAWAGLDPEPDDVGPSSWPQQTATKSHAADRLLLDAFLSLRSRTRGPLVAVNDRTMITNVGASELLQPGDGCLLWEHVVRNHDGADEPATVVLSSGVAVKVAAQFVGDQMSPMGAVIRLVLEVPPRDAARATGRIDGALPPPSTASRGLDPSLMTGWTDLTDTERTVAELVARGMTNKQVGRRLFLSRHTIDYHLRRVFKKLGLNSRVELARALGEHYEALNG